LASEVINPVQKSLGLMDLTIERNGYGRQIDSRIAGIDLDGENAEAVFIRAPVIRRVGPAAKGLASYQGSPILVEQGKHLAATFQRKWRENANMRRRLVEKVAGEETQPPPLHFKQSETFSFLLYRHLVPQ